MYGRHRGYRGGGEQGGGIHLDEVAGAADYHSGSPRCREIGLYDHAPVVGCPQLSGAIEKLPHPYYNNPMGANKNYKDSVFSLLFSDPDLLRELYCALENVALPDDVPISINTLKDALFQNRVNDISFAIGGKQVVLIEHQSTINPNMPLRLLMYITRVYEKMLQGRNIHTSKLIPLPRPEFFVLYNGLAPFPDEKVVNLSDAFERPDIPGLAEKERPALELEVRVVNINQGRNGSLLEQSKTLSQYSVFIAKAREFEKVSGDRNEAVAQAVRYCRENDILKDFLEKHGTEVINMLLTEWNWDEALATRFQEGREEGIEAGVEKGREEGREETARNALAQGFSVEVIQSITGLSLENIKSLQAE